MKLKRLIPAFTVCTALLAITPVVNAQTVQLTASSWLPPTHAVVADFLVPWMQQVSDATEQRVKIRLLPKAVTNPQGHLDAVREGLVDLTFISHSYYPGRFELTKFAVMPFSGESAESRSVAAWDIYEKYLLKADEHVGVHLLGIYAHGPGMVMTTTKQVASINDFQGLKIRVGGGMAADVAQAVEASTLAKPAPESYELLSSGVADGVFFPAESLVSFKLDRLVKYVTVFPGGLYSDTHAVIMNEKALAQISPKDQEAIKKLSGQYLARMAGQAWDKHDAAGLAALNSGSIKVTHADAAFVDAIKEKTESFRQAWLAAADKKGIDGPAALAQFHDEITKLDAK